MQRNLTARTKVTGRTAEQIGFPTHGQSLSYPKDETVLALLRLASIFVGGLSQRSVEGSILINLPQTEEVGYNLQMRIYRKITQACGRTELE